MFSQIGRWSVRRTSSQTTHQPLETSNVEHRMFIRNKNPLVIRDRLNCPDSWFLNIQDTANIKEINHKFTAMPNGLELFVCKTKNTARRIKKQDWGKTSFKQVQTTKSWWYLKHIAVSTIPSFKYQLFATAKGHTCFSKLTHWKGQNDVLLGNMNLGTSP